MSAAQNHQKTMRICFIGLMSAIVFVVNYLRIPFMGTQLHMTNALCALSGLLFGPGGGFLAAGIGSGLYDIVGGYGAECIVTFVNKGMIALVAGLIAGRAAHDRQLTRADCAKVILGCALGALTYVALYMLKTAIAGHFIDGLTPDALNVKLASKLPGSLMNAVFAGIAAPLLFSALRPALKGAGLFDKM
ncbi:MAG: ECF transporter S component [Clostridia bacterium]|nr:ECF transporter S component [Clostridia bacterium]